MKNPTFCHLAGMLALVFGGCAAVEPPVESRSVATQGHASAGAPAHVLVVYFSRTGNTEQMAHGVVQGAQSVPGVVTTVKEVTEVSKEDLTAAHGIVLGCPTYFANIPGEMKTFMDDWNWKWGVDFTDKIGGAFATGGGQAAGHGHVVTSLFLFMLNNRMMVAGPLYRNEKTGSVWGEPGSAAVTGPFDAGVSQDELEGARRLGKRIAGLASTMRRLPEKGPL